MVYSVGLLRVAPQVAPAIARLPKNLRVSCKLYLVRVPATARVGCHAPRLPLIPFVDRQLALESPSRCPWTIPRRSADA